MDAPSQASIIANLESSNYTELHKLIDSLKQFQTSINGALNKKPSRRKQGTSSSSSSIRALTKSFLPFLNKVLSILPKRLSESPKSNSIENSSAKLFESYRLGLDCLDLVCSQLSGKVYAIQLQKARFIHCLQKWGRYEEAVEEGFRVLESVKGIEIESLNLKDGKFVPNLVENGRADVVDCEFGNLVVDIVVSIVQCVVLSKTKDAGKYDALLVLLMEVNPWFRVLEAGLSQKLHRVLLSYMRQATVLLVKEVSHFEGDLVPRFCEAVLKEYAHLLEDQGPQGSTAKESTEFFELVTYCAHKCQSASMNVRIAVSMHMYRSANTFSQDLAVFSLIERLYAIGLYFTECALQLNSSCFTVSGSLADTSPKRFLLDSWNKLINDCKDFVEKRFPCPGPDDMVPKLCTWENSASFYFNALKFLSRPLAEFVNSERKRIITEWEDDVLLGNTLRIIQDGFLQCFYLFRCHNKGGSVEIDKTLLSIAVAAFTLSLTLNCKSKESMKFVKYLLSDEYIQGIKPQGLKYLIALLHNVGVDWYRNKQLKEASKALKFCCRAAWDCCLILVGKLKELDGEKPIVDCVTEACAMNSLFLEILCQIDSDKLTKVTLTNLEKWCIARSIVENLPSPAALVKSWVKIQCKLHKNSDATALILGSFLLNSSSMLRKKVVKQTVGIILEQELSAYQDLSAWYPELSQKMQMHILDILLQDIYAPNECLQRSTILTKKGLLLRARGIENMNDCIQCLSQAINTIEGPYGGVPSQDAPALHQLAAVYCLRALCVQEAEPNSKQVCSDVHHAAKIWLSTDLPRCFPNGQSDSGCENMLLLLYHVLDLASVKGDVTLHSDVSCLIVKLFKWMNFPMAKVSTLLWGSRRLSHALCVTPIDEAFIMNLSKYYSKDFVSLDFWISCMEDSLPLSVGFQQNFSFLSSLFPSRFHSHKHSMRSDISADDVKEVTLQLISNDPVPPYSAFVAGYLYYDMSEKLISRGQMVEALFYAKEAHRLRSKLLQEHFLYSFERDEEKYDEAGRRTQQQKFFFNYFKVRSQIAVKAWALGSVSWDSNGCILTPWNVLQCYLESTLQVGIIQETIGNGAEAEALFQWGKSISCLQNLPSFIAAFSAGLGKVFRKKCLWDLAAEELESAKKVSITCLRCKLMQESIINEQLGKMYRSGIFHSKKNPYESSIENLIYPAKQNNSKRTKGENTGFTMLQNEVAADAEQFRRKGSRASNKTICQKCSPPVLENVGSLVYFIHMKWEFACKRQTLRLLMGLGKCEGASGGVHKSHETYSRCISILAGGNPFCDCNSHCSLSVELDLISKEIAGDMLAVERAALLYSVCWVSLKGFNSKKNRAARCDLCSIQMPRIVLFLKHSFVLSREVPVLFKKVSQLLAIIFIISASKVDESIPSSSSMSSCKLQRENCWAAYFHQASVGTHYNLRVLSMGSSKTKASTMCNIEGSQVASPPCRTSDVASLHRVAPESTQNMEAFVDNFFDNLPSSPVICMSFIRGASASLLLELLHYPSSINTWMLLSRMNANSQPCVVLLPLGSVLRENEITSCCSTFGEKNTVKGWCSPWGSTVVDDVAPLFQLILRENYLSSATFPKEDTERNRAIWWTQRQSLDKHLHKLLRDMEELWFGPWKCLLLGGWLDCSALNSVVKELNRSIKAKCKAELNENFLEVVLGGVKFAGVETESIPCAFLETGCYIDRIGYQREQTGMLNEPSNGADNTSSLVCELVLAAMKQLEEEHSLNREPVVLVLDNEVQMLPWENMPVLREQEVYRMPSVTSISAALQRKSMLRKEASRLDATFPLIDPLDAFYLLNPSGDLKCTQAEFEEWFRTQSLEGKAGMVPSTEELTLALKNRDLFIYFGHGSGAQYMPTDEILKVENCAASLLMGCSSGCLYLNGSYTPQGTALSYIFSGSPIVVANLWEVTDKDIDRFGKAVLNSWVEQRSLSSISCIQCSILAEEFKSMNMNVNKKPTRKGRGKKKTSDDTVLHEMGTVSLNEGINGNMKKRGEKEKSGFEKDDVTEEGCGYCRHKLKAGYFVSQARKACKLPYLIGAAPVCYGVPTGIRRKKDI